VRVAVIAIVAAVAGVPTPAEACSCGRFDRLTVESCRGATRVFAGTVARYGWPTAYDGVISKFSRSHPVEVELAVDRVWHGDVGTSVATTTGLGGGDCGIHPLPGTRFVVCDDKLGDAPPDYALCSAPAFDDFALEAGLEGALGPPRMPSMTLWRAGPSWWRHPLLLPLVLVAVFALIGTRRDTTTDTPLRYRVLVLALIACAAGVVAMRAIAYALELHLLAAFGPVTLAAILGAVVGYRGQRRPGRFAGRFGGLAAAIAFAALPVTLGYAPPHLPWQGDAVACSRERAKAILSRAEPLSDAVAREPYACTDLGMARFRVVQDRCLGFADGDGGMWFVCRDGDDIHTFIGGEVR
jgi:hypothetical protein